MPSMIFLLTLTLLSFADPGLETECTDCDTPALPAERVLMEIPESIIKQHKAEKIPTPAGRKVPIIAGGCKVNSSFGWRKHPILKRRIHHDGTDVRAKKGTPMRAPMAGKVIKTGSQSGYGYQVFLKLDNGLELRFNHMVKSGRPKVGARLKAGDILGQVGNSGRVTGPHLHLEVFKNGKLVDPLSVFKARELCGG